MPFNIDSTTWNSICAAVARGRYSVLLGAGASADAQLAPPSLDKVPGPTTLTDMLRRDFKLPKSSRELDLKRAFALASRDGRISDNGQLIDQYMTTIFKGCSPPDWYEQFVRLRWNRIWTLNIDDVVENSYDQWRSSRIQTPISLGWDTPHQDVVHPSVQIVHLHGRSWDNPSNLVFDIAQYFRAGQHDHAWHKVFGDHYSQYPFFVIGASLIEEYDLLTLLQQRNTSQFTEGLPSLIILRSFDDALLEEVEDLGLIPVEATAEQFISTLWADVQPLLKEPLIKLHDGSIPLDDLSVRFIQQFELLTSTSTSSRRSRPDFYSGYDPTWIDILDNLDAPLIRDDRVHSLALDKHPKQQVICLLGEAFCGKTTSLLRAGRRLLNEGYDVFRFRGDESPDAEAIIWLIQRNLKTVLLFDGIADFSPELGDLVRRLKNLDLPIRIISTERKSRRSRLYSIPAENLKIVETGRLIREDATSIIEKRRAAKRLGKVATLSRKEQLDHFMVKSRGDMLDALSSLEIGGGFQSRVRRELDSIPNASGRNVYVTACIAYALGYTLPVSLVASVTSQDTSQLLESVLNDSQLSSILIVERGRIRPVHRRIASWVIDLSHDILFDSTLNLARGLSTYLNVKSVQHRTIYYLVARELMRQKVIAEWLGVEDSLEWYQLLENEFDWNARYWEQRARAEAERGRFDRAESFAAEGLNRHRDPFTLNTMGNILMRKSHEYKEIEHGSHESRETYYRGLRFIAESRRASQMRFPHPYVTFFHNTLAFAGQNLASSSTIQGLRTHWNDWYREAESAPPFQHEDQWNQLRDFHGRWLELNVTGQDRNP
jgi:hypothetical protein